MDALTVIIAIATPLLAFAGAAWGHKVSRKSALELDRWRKREETMRLLRWAVELATDDDEAKAKAGLTVLGALLDSPLLDDADVELVATVVGAVARDLQDDPATDVGS